jgi:hypothetical protein
MEEECVKIKYHYRFYAKQKGIVPLPPSTYQGTILGMPQCRRPYCPRTQKSEVIRPAKNKNKNESFGTRLVETSLCSVMTYEFKLNP